MSSSNELPGKFSGLYSVALEFALEHLSATQLEILGVLMAAPNRTASAGEIAKQLGLRHHITVNAGLASVGTSVLEFMDLNPSDAVQLFPKPWQILAIKGTPGSAKGFPWQLRPAVVDGLTGLGFPEKYLDCSDERISVKGLIEAIPGATWVETRRRSALARAQCLALHSPVCAVCGMNFGQIYGSTFSDCIHVHHLHPIAAATEPRNVDPSTDLIPVCPNCHAVIHAHGEFRSIAEVRDLIKVTAASVL